MLVSYNIQAQNTYYVNDNSTVGDIYCTAVGNNLNAGNTPALPKATLQAAINAASAGDTIYVDKVYFDQIDGNRDITFNKAITVIGAGMNNTIFTSHSNHRFGIVSANNVHIKNMQLFDFFLLAAGQVISVNNNVTGFKITNVMMKKNLGGGSAARSINLGSGSNSVFDGLVFTCSGFNGTAGGAIAANSCTLNIKNSAFFQSHDAAGNGGALQINGTSTVTIDKTTFDSNIARAGGAIAQFAGSLTVTNSCFNRNMCSGDSGTSSNGGGHYYSSGAPATTSASFTNCNFTGAFFVATTNPSGTPAVANSNISNDGNAINLNATLGTYSFNTCTFENNNQPNANFDNGLDFNLDKGSGVISVTINNCKFANDMFGGAGTGGSDAVNIWNVDLSATEFVVTNSGAKQTSANQDGALGNNYSYSGTAPGGNDNTQTSNTTVTCSVGFSSCAATVICATEAVAPVILKCVENKTVACGTTLADYRSEVSAYDDCSFTIAQSPAAGSALSGTTTVTMTVTDLKGNFTTCTFTITVDSSTWNGTAWSNGTPTSSTAVTFTGNFSSSADLAACSVLVTNNAAVVINSGHNYTVQNAVTVDTGSTFTFNNNANLVQVNNVSNTGNIIMKRNTNLLKRLDYTIWSAPVAGQNLLAFSPLTLTNRFYTYNTATDVHSTVNPSTTSFATGLGYQIRVPNDHPISTPTIWTGTFTGVPNNGPYNVTISAAGNKYNMVGNPYPSPINLTTFSSVNSANFTGTIWFWRKENSIVTQGVWSTWNAGTFVLASDPGTSGLTITDNVARNGQGFLIKGSSTTLSFTNAMRVTNTSNQFFRTTTSDLNRIWLNLTNTSGHFSQQAVRYSEGGTNDMDRMDAENINSSDVLFTSLRSNLATETNKFTIQSRKYPFDENDVVPLSVKISTAGTYSISIHQKDGLFEDGSQAIYLKDNLTNTETNLNNGSYSFVSDAGVFDARFELKYVASALSNNQNNFENNVVVYQQNEIIYVNSSTEPIQNVKIFDIRGRLVHTSDNIHATSTNVKLHIEKQVVLMKITLTNGAVITRKILN